MSSLLLLALAIAQPRMLISASPRIQNVFPGQTAYVRVVVRILDPGQRIGCYSITWIWGDGSVSIESPGCDPYLLQDERPFMYVPLPRTHAYRRAGEYLIRVTLRAPDVVVSASLAVLVMGMALDEE